MKTPRWKSSAIKNNNSVWVGESYLSRQMPPLCLFSIFSLMPYSSGVSPQNKLETIDQVSTLREAVTQLQWRSTKKEWWVEIRGGNVTQKPNRLLFRLFVKVRGCQEAGGLQHKSSWHKPRHFCLFTSTGKSGDRSSFWSTVGDVIHPPSKTDGGALMEAFEDTLLMRIAKPNVKLRTKQVQLSCCRAVCLPERLVSGSVYQRNMRSKIKLLLNYRLSASLVTGHSLISAKSQPPPVCRTMTAPY